MSLYSYSALDAGNNVKRGIIEEIDKAAAARRLLGQGLRPLEIKPQKAGSKAVFSFDSFRKNKLTKADLDFFTTQIALLLNAGLSLDAALRTMKQNSQKPAFKHFTGEIERKLKEGKSFSEALADYPMFSAMYISIVRAGEEGGILPAMLLRISEYQKTFQELTQFIVSAAIYPIILLVVGIVAVGILVTTILPRFEVLFQGMGQKLPFHVRVLMDGAGFISSHMLLTLVVLVAPIAWASYWFKTEQGRLFLDAKAITLPLISGFVRELETTRIFRTLEVLVKNGVHLATALKICSGVAANIEYQRLLQNATRALKEGQRIAPKLQGKGLFPDMAVDLLAIGEESGSVGEVCGQVADHYDKELRQRVKRIIALIEPLFILTIALGAGYIVVSMLTIIMSINDIAG
ncbi:MAG: type II secretion system F family protein [Desulfobulbaceae bacterium]|nr:type II secretion system F family protein [Desulfobulbaceae bacterium]